jgi:uncharacterized protein (DUF1015 family)
MVQFVPFSGWRYDLSQVGVLSEVTAPVPNLIDEKLQDELYQRHPCNAVRVTLNRAEPGDESTLDRCGRVDDFLRLWKREGILIREHHAAFYVWQQTRKDSADSTVSVIGRLRLDSQAADPSTIELLTSTDPAVVNESLQLLRHCRAQLFPIQGFILTSPAGSSAEEKSPAGSLLADLLPRLQARTPFELQDDHGNYIRVWPVTDNHLITEIQQRLRHHSVLITGGADQITAALEYRNELAAAGRISGEHDGAGFVMVSLTDAHAPGVRILPLLYVFPEEAVLSEVQLTAALGSKFRSQRVGDECFAAQDACELAQLNFPEPAVAFCTSDGTWFLITECSDELTAGQLNKSSTVNKGLSRAAEVLRLGNSLLQHLRTCFDTAAMPLTAAWTSSGSLGAHSGKPHRVRILVPPVSLRETLDEFAHERKTTEAAVHVAPQPLSGIVYYSLDH